MRPVLLGARRLAARRYRNFVATQRAQDEPAQDEPAHAGTDEGERIRCGGVLKASAAALAGASAAASGSELHQRSRAVLQYGAKSPGVKPAQVLPA